MVNALPPADTCKIEYQDIGGMTHLAAVLIPAKAREGTYQFQVRSISEGGVSSNMQGESFLPGEDIARICPRLSSATHPVAGQRSCRSSMHPEI